MRQRGRACRCRGCAACAMRAAHEAGVQHAGQLMSSTKRPWPVSSAGIFEPRRRARRNASRPSLSPASVARRSAASSAASTMPDSRCSGRCCRKCASRTSCLGRVGIVAQKFGQRRQHARRAEAALQAVIVAKRLLQRVSSSAVGARPSTVAISRRPPAPRASGRSAPSGRREDRAGAADAVLAAEMRAGEPELVAQEIGEREARLDLCARTVLPLTVSGDLPLLAHDLQLPRPRSGRVGSARRDSTAARCRR